MATLSSLTGYSFGYRADTNYVSGSAVNTVAFGTSWKDNNNAQDIGTFGGLQAYTNIRGRQQCSCIRALTGGIACTPGKTAGTNFNNASGGVVLVGHWHSGSLNSNRGMMYTGTTAAGGAQVLRQTATGLFSISAEANASPIVFDNLMIPANPTAIMLESAGGATWAKIFGQTAVAKGVSPVGANNAWLFFHSDPAGGAADRLPFLIDEVAFFDGANVQSQASAIEAILASNYGLIAPTMGHIICLGSSLGTGDYHGLSVSYPGEIGAALPTWFVKNNCREGMTFATCYAERAAIVGASASIIDNPADRPLGTGKPLIFSLEFGVNEVFSSTAAAVIQADATTLVAYLRATNPTAAIIIHTVVVVGSTAAKNTIRLAYNAWLTGGGLSAYGVIVNDAANYDPTFTPATNTDADVNTCTGSSNFTITDLANAPTVDHVHWGWAGAVKQFQSYVAAAQRGVMAALYASGGKPRARMRVRA